MICRTHTANYQCRKIQQLSKDTATEPTGSRLTVKFVQACGRLPVDFLILVRPNAARGCWSPHTYTGSAYRAQALYRALGALQAGSDRLQAKAIRGSRLVVIDEQ